MSAICCTTSWTGHGSGQRDEPKERDDAAIQHWVKKRWPQLKKGKTPERADCV
jgi:hypothetical protein